MSLQRYDVFRATFQPLRRDDLKPDTAAWIGREIEWVAAWMVDDGPYAGQWACMPAPGSPTTPFVWVPECDLEGHP